MQSRTPRRSVFSLPQFEKEVKEIHIVRGRNNHQLSIITTTNTFIYTYQTHTMAITKRPRDDASADRAAKKHKKGFTVGPQNLPDGTHRRKSTHALISVCAIPR